MSHLISLESLAREKGLSPDTLRDFGVSDQPGGGVRIEYGGSDGNRGRARYRWNMGGVDGSTWEHSVQPIIAYWHVTASDPTHQRGMLLLCEGESSCWTLWHCGFAAVGIPGVDSVTCLRARDLVSAETVLIVVEPNDPETYPLGRDHYIMQVTRQLDKVKYSGRVKRLYLDSFAADINALYQADPSAFTERLDSILTHAVNG